MPNIEVPGYGSYFFPDNLSHDEIMKSLKDEILEAKARKKSYGQVGDFAVNALTGTVQGAGQGISGLLRMMGADEAADKVKDYAAINKNYELPSGSTGAQWGQMLGSSLGLLGLGSAASLVAGPVGGVAVMGGLGVGGGIERVEEDIQRAHMRGQDLSEDEKFKQRLIGGAIGSTEAMPLELVAGKFVRPLMKVIGKGGGEAAETALHELTQGHTLRGYLKGAGQQAAAEAAQSVGAEIGYKSLEKRYDPNVNIFEGIGDQAAAGGGIGALMSIALRGAGHIAAKRRGIPQAHLSEPPVDTQADEPLGGLFKGETSGMYGGVGSPAWANAPWTGGGMYGVGTDGPGLHEKAQAQAASDINNAAAQGYGMYGQQPPEAPMPPPGMYGARSGLGDLADQIARANEPGPEPLPETLRGMQLGLGEQGLAGSQMNVFGPQQEASLRAAAAADAEARSRAADAAQFQPGAQPGLFGTPEAPVQQGLPLGEAGPEWRGPSTTPPIPQSLSELGLPGQLGIFGPQQQRSMFEAAIADRTAREQAAARAQDQAARTEEAGMFAPTPEGQRGLFGQRETPTQAPLAVVEPELETYLRQAQADGRKPAVSTLQKKFKLGKAAAQQALATAFPEVASPATQVEAVTTPVEAPAPVQPVAPQPQVTAPSVAPIEVAPVGPTPSPITKETKEAPAIVPEQRPQPPPVEAAPAPAPTAPVVTATPQNALAEIETKFPVNPANPEERVLMAQGKPAASFVVEPREGRLRLRTMQSVEPKSGVGSLLLDRLTKIADKHGVTLELTASPYGPEPRMGKDDLVKWYESRGFRQEAGFDPALGYMVREPGGVKAEAAAPIRATEPAIPALSTPIRAEETAIRAIPAPAPAIPATPVAAAPAAPAVKAKGRVEKIAPAAEYIRTELAAGRKPTVTEVKEKFALSDTDFTKALNAIAPPPAPPRAAAPKPAPVSERIAAAANAIRAQMAAKEPLSPEALQHQHSLTPEELSRAIENVSGPAPPPRPVENKLAPLVKETWRENKAGVTPEDLEAFLNRVINLKQGPSKAIRLQFKENYLDAAKALREMGVVELDPRLKTDVLTVDRVPYESAPAYTPPFTLRPPVKLSELAQSAPRSELYTPQEYERVARQMRQDKSPFTEALFDVFQGRSDEDVRKIAEHMTAYAAREGNPVFEPAWVPKYERKGARTSPIAGLADLMGTKWDSPVHEAELAGLVPDYKLSKDFIDNGPGGITEPAPPVELAAMQARIKKVLDPELTKMLGDYGGPLNNKKTALKVVDKLLTTWGARAEGVWHKSEQLMQLAMDVATPDMPIEEQIERMRKVMHHEIIHAGRGLFIDQDWKNLTHSAEKRGYLDVVKEKYAGKPGYDKQQLNEEAVANMFSSALDPNGRPMAEGEQKLLDRFVGFTQRLGNGLRGMGFQTPEDIMQRLASGQLAARGQQTEGIPGERSGPLYKLPDESPWQRIVRGAEDIRAGRDPGHLTNAADRAQAQHLAGESRLDLSRVKNVDPDEHLKISRMGLPDWLANHLRSSVAAEAIKSGRDPKEKIGFDKFSEWARSMMSENEGLDVSKLDTHYNQMQSSAAFLGARDALNGLHQQIAKEAIALEENRHKMDKPTMLAAEAKLETMRNGAEQLTNALLPARSAAGRSLAYQRIAAEGSFDSLYWMSQAKRAMRLPSNASLPPEVQTDLIKHTQAGQQAQQDAAAAKANGDTAGEKEAQQRVIKAKQGVSKTVSALSKNTGMEAWRSLWKAGLLSGLQTQIANFTSNGFMAGLERLSSVPGSWIDAALAKHTGVYTTANQLDSDALKATKDAMGPGWKDAAKIAYDSVIKGEPPPAQQEFLGKINQSRGVDFGNMPGAKYLEHGVNAVFGMQQAGDAPYAAMALASEMQGMADNVARTEQLQGTIPKGRDALVKRRRELQANPTPEMEAAARDRAKYHTFANDNAASKGAEAFKRSMEQMGPMGQSMATLFDMAVPFIKVPANVFSSMLQYSPVGLTYAGGKGISQLAQKGWAKARGKEMQAKLTPDQQRMYATLLSRGAVGSAIMALGYFAAQAGIAAGFRDDQDTAGRAADEAVGRPQGSLKVGNRWLQMNRISPVGNLMAIGASMYREGERPLSNPGQRVGNLLGAAAKSMNEMPFMQGMEGLVDAVKNPGKQGGAYLQRQIGSVVPTLVANVASTIDPKMREMKDAGMGAGIQSRLPLIRNLGIPGLVDPLKVHHDVLGREMDVPGVPYVGSMLDIFRSRAERTDPTSQAMIQSGFGFIRPDKRPGEAPEVTYLRQELAGTLARKYMDKAATSSAMRRAKDAEEQREVLEDALNHSRRDLSKLTGKSARRYSNATPEAQGAMLNQWLARTQRQLSQ